MNINTASKTELVELEGVGKATAQTIIDARPITGWEELEAVVPPAAWVKLYGSGVYLDFSVEGSQEAAEDPVEVTIPTARITVGEAIEVLREAGHPLLAGSRGDVVMDGARLRRLLPGDPLEEGTGKTYRCIWNMQWGPSLVARMPADEAAQTEIHQWFEERGVHIEFVHYGPSGKVPTRTMGPAPVVLFEVIDDERQGGE